MKTFYVLWNPDSLRPPTARFNTLAEAERVAELMARRFEGQTFHVLENKGSVVTADVSWTRPRG